MSSHLPLNHLQMFAQLRSHRDSHTVQLRSLGLFLGLGLLVQCCSAESGWAQDQYVDYTGNFPSSQLDDISVPVRRGRRHYWKEMAQLIAKKSGMERACGSLLANHMQLLCSGKRKRSGFQSFYPMGPQSSESTFSYQSLQKRGILESCCHQPCSKTTLMRFCP